MSQYRIISIFDIRIFVIRIITIFVKELSISFINCAQEGASLITKQRAVKKKMCICVNIKATRTKWIQSILKTMSEFMLTQVTQAQSCEVFVFFAVVTIKYTVWRWSNKLQQILFENTKTNTKYYSLYFKDIAYF